MIWESLSESENGEPALEQIARHGVIRFYLIYFCDYLTNLWRLREHDAAYRHIRFEREARERVRLICDDLDTANSHS